MARSKIKLAPHNPACFIPHRLRPKRKSFVVKSGLAGLLIFLLLWSSSLAVSSAHGRSHHSDRPSDQCVLCLFAHGHVIGAESQRVFSLNGSWSVALVLPAYPAAFSTADRRLSPSRAPPLALSAIVVG